jgi:hypothetical protein
MAQPNIVNVSTIRGNTAALNVSTVAANVVANPALSNSVLKINTIMIANMDGANTADITASLFKLGVEYKIAHTISVPSDATLILISKDISIYLEESDYIRLSASANGRLHAICSYEEIS